MATSDRAYIHALVDALPEDAMPNLAKMLAALVEEEPADDETLEMINTSLAEPGEDVDWDDIKRRYPS